MKSSIHLVCGAPLDSVRDCVRDELRLSAWYGEPRALTDDASQPLNATVPVCCACWDSRVTRETLADDEKQVHLEARGPTTRGELHVHFHQGVRYVRVYVELRVHAHGTLGALLVPFVYLRIRWAAAELGGRLRLRLSNLEGA